MSSIHQSGNEETVERERSKRAIGDDVDETMVELRPSVEQEMQASVDTNHPDAKPEGLTLEAEERLMAREWEIERTTLRIDRQQTSDREKRTSRVVEKENVKRRRAFGKRAASVTPWADPERGDPRAELPREQLATVNREAARLAMKLTGWSRAAVSRRLAERVVEGESMMGAVVGTYEELQRAPGRIVPIAAISEVGRKEVDIQGKVTTLWEPSHSKIAQVGLLEDETGKTRFTVWKASRQPTVEVGEHVVFRTVAKNWYGGRVSVALTGWSSVTIREHEGWWTE